MFNSLVYIAAIPPDIEIDEVYPDERAEQIENCTNPAVRAEKYYVWKLLELAVFESLGRRMDELNFTRDEYGKWHCDACFFSLSHAGGAVAVAVSDKNIGVDIEAVRRCREGLERRILTEAEGKIFSTLEGDRAGEYIIEKWSQKESIFKTLGVHTFEPTRLETADFSVISRPVDINGERFILSVCTEDADIIIKKID